MAASTTTPFATSLNFSNNQNLNFLQQTQPQSAHLQQNSFNALQFNAVNSNLLQQPQQAQQPQQQQQQMPKETQYKDTTFTKIFVGGLPYHTTDESLTQFFQKFGKIEEAVVINDRQTGKSRGYGFVTMETNEAAEAAVLDPNPIIDGRKANVNLAYLGVKSRLVAPTGIIPLTVRYQMPPTQSTAYGFHPFYYHPAQNTNNHPSQFLAPNLLIPAQQNNNLVSSTTPAANNSSGLFDLAYNTRHVAALNSNRTSPFENAMNATAPFSIPFNSSNTNQNINTLISQTHQNNHSYFAPFPQHLNSVFQPQLQDRL